MKKIDSIFKNLFNYPLQRQFGVLWLNGELTPTSESSHPIIFRKANWCTEGFSNKKQFITALSHRKYSQNTTLQGVLPSA